MGFVVVLFDSDSGALNLDEGVGGCSFQTCMSNVLLIKEMPEGTITKQQHTKKAHKSRAEIFWSLDLFLHIERATPKENQTDMQPI